MKTRKRVSFSEREESGDGGPTRSSPRKRLRTQYASEGGNDGRGDSDSEPVEEDESSSDEELHKSDENSKHEEEKGAALKRRPMLILHKLEHLQGDFHLLLNNVVLPQKGSSVPEEEPTETTTDDKCVGADVSSELPEQILAPDNLDSNCAPKEEETEEKVSLGAEKTVELQNTNCENDEDACSSAEECTDELTEGTSEIVENIILTLENEACEEEMEKRLDTEKSSAPLEETSPQNSISENEESTLTEDASSAAEEPHVSESNKGTTLDVPSPVENTTENIQNEVEVVAAECPTTEGSLEEVGSHDTNESAQSLLHQQLTERSPPSSSSTITYDEAATAQPSAELDAMDLEQLKREKLKMQIKVLKLQEAYYTLQLKNMNQ